MPRYVALVSLSALLLLPCGTALAGFDGSKPFLCAITEAIECDDDGNCVGGSADDVNMPAFIRVDVAGKNLSEHNGERTTAIQSHTRANGQLLLQGVQERVWNVSISEESGLFTATAAEHGTGFVFFGACTDF
jgi:hypothetical protein